MSDQRLPPDPGLEARLDALGQRQDHTDEAVRGLSRRMEEGFAMLGRDIREMSRPNLPLMLAVLTVLGGIFAWAYSTVGSQTYENREDISGMLRWQGRLDERVEANTGFREWGAREMIEQKVHDAEADARISTLEKEIEMMRRAEDENAAVEEADLRRSRESLQERLRSSQGHD